MKTNPDIIYADEDILVVNKPAGITVIPDRIHTNRETLQSILQKTYGKLLVVHRIDKDTTGIICFARTEAAHRNLSLQFQNHLVKKKYRAIVKGKLKTKNGVVETPIVENPAHRGTMMTSKKGKPSVTIYTVEEEFRNTTLLEVEIKTGRTHQIRVHLSSIGHPLLVDEIYGATPAFYLSSIKRSYKNSVEEERPTIGRLTLHASSLTLEHPVSKEETTFKAPLPKDLVTVLKLLKKYDC